MLRSTMNVTSSGSLLRERQGLQRFYELAAARGAIAGVPELRFADTARVR